MVIPKLKVGDTFVFTEEMNRDDDQYGGLYSQIGKEIIINFVNDVAYNCSNGYEYKIRVIDKYLPDPKPRTLDDMKEGDVLVDRSDNRYLVLGRSGRIVALSDSEIEVDDGKWEWMTMAELKNLGYKLADQPEERWKPEDNEKVWTVLSSCKVARVPFSESWQAEYEMGNIFKTREEAKQAAEDLKAWWLDRINNQK